MSNLSKICHSCRAERPIGDFYTHKMMRDGTLNHCKDCVRARVKAEAKSPRGRLRDKLRQQKPERKAWVRQFSRKQNQKFAQKRKARAKFWGEFRKGTIEKLPCRDCGTTSLVEAHHPDYTKPYEVVWLCSLHHKAEHRKFRTT